MTSVLPGPGTLIDFRDGDTVTAGVVLGEEKGKLLVLSERGREERIAASRVALVVGPMRGGQGFRNSGPETASRAEDYARRAAAEAPAVDLPVLWELLVEEGAPAGQTIARLATLALGREDGEARGAVLRSLLANRVYFTRKDDLWFPRAPETVDEMRHQRLREQQKQRARGSFVRRAREALAGAGVPAPPPEPETADLPVAGRSDGSEDERALVSSVEALAVFGANAPEARGAQRLLGEIGLAYVTPEEGAFTVCRAMGLFEPDENLLIRRYGLRVDFEEPVLRAAELAAARLPDLLGGVIGPPRRDLRSEEAFTIDDAGTTDLDDAVSVRLEPDGTVVLGIHVADASSFIDPGDAVDAEAEARATSHYFSDRRIMMIPPAISEKAASLIPGVDRPVLSFIARFAGEESLTGFEILPALIRSRRRITYDEVNDLLAPGGDAGRGGVAGTAGVEMELEILWRLARRLEAARAAAGAVRISAPEVEAVPGPGGRVLLSRVQPDLPGRRLIAEMMVLAGKLAAEFCVARGIPVLFRRQAPPDAPVEPLPEGVYDPLLVRKARRAMKRSEVTPQPARHAALGLDAYAQATSPLRRFQDLVAHRQILAHLRGSPLPYDPESLRRIAATNDESEKQSRLAERGTREYWLLRYLEQLVGTGVEAVILETNGKRTDVELCESLVQGSVGAREGHLPGARLSVRIERVVPRAGLLVLREA